MNRAKWTVLAVLAVALTSCGLADGGGFSTNSGKIAEIGYVFDLSALPVVTLTVATNEWNTLLKAADANPKNEVDVVADFEFNKSGTVESAKSVGLRMRGRAEGSAGQAHSATSPVWHRARLKIDFTETINNQRFRGLRALTLKTTANDPSYVREVYCYDLYRRMGVKWAPRASFAKVFVKLKEENKTVYFGVYRMNEFVDKAYLNTRFSNNNGNLWKCGVTTNGKADLKPSANLTVGKMIGLESVDNLNGALTYTPTYDLKVGKSDLTNAAAQLTAFIDKINSLNGTAFTTYLSNNFDIDQYLRTLAVDTMVGHWDGYWVSYGNYYLYFDTLGIAHFVPDEMDDTLGSCRTLANSGTRGIYNFGDTNGGAPLASKILAVPAYKATYAQYIAKLKNADEDLFAFSKSTNRIAQWNALIAAAVANDTGEENAITDLPSPKGICGFYRLMTGDDSGNWSEANFFKTRIKNSAQ